MEDQSGNPQSGLAGPTYTPINTGFTPVQLLRITLAPFVCFLLIITATTEQEYNYYVLVRWITTLFFLLSACSNFAPTKGIGISANLLFAVLFNPFLKFTFEAETWHCIDWATAVCLLLMSLFDIGMWRTKKKIFQERSEQINRWIENTMQEISTGKWGYHLAIAELKVSNLNKDQQEEAYQILFKRYMNLSDADKKKDYDQYQLAQTLQITDAQFKKWK